MCAPDQSLISNIMDIENKFIERDKARAAALLANILANNFPSITPKKDIQDIDPDEYRNSRIKL